MRFYVATSLSRAADHREITGHLCAMGHDLTYDWTGHGSVQDEGPRRIAEVARAEASGVAIADVVIVLLPGGRGTHAELGMAYAWGKRIVIHGDMGERHCAFYYAPRGGPRITRHTGALADLAADIHEETLTTQPSGAS